VDDGRPLSPSHYYGIFIGEEKPKRVRPSWLLLVEFSLKMAGSQRCSTCHGRVLHHAQEALRPAVKCSQSRPKGLPPLLSCRVQAKERVDIKKLDANVSLSGSYLWVFDNDNIQAGDILFGPAQGWEYPFQLK